jgi:hypothetical protein
MSDTPDEPTSAPAAEPTAAEPATAPAAAEAADTSLHKTQDERKALLDAALARLGAQGWRIENRSDFQATIAKGHRPNHILHLILSIVTAGLWLIVWLLIVIFGGEKRKLVTVDPYGNIAESKV